MFACIAVTVHNGSVFASILCFTAQHMIVWTETGLGLDFSKSQDYLVFGFWSI